MSVWTAGATGVADTATVVSTLDAWLREAVTVLAAPASPIAVFVTVSETVGDASLS